MSAVPVLTQPLDVPPCCCVLLEKDRNHEWIGGWDGVLTRVSFSWCVFYVTKADDCFRS